MKQILFILLIINIGCNQSASKSTSKKTEGDSLQHARLIIDSCYLNLKRFKTFENKNQSIKNGKTKLNTNEIRLEYFGKMLFNINEGNMTYNKKVFELNCTIQKNQIIRISLPDSSNYNLIENLLYADTGKTTIKVSIKGNLYPKSQPYTISLFLETTDTSGLVENATLNKFNLATPTKQGKLEVLFNIDGKKWNLFNSTHKNKILKDSMNCILYIRTTLDFN